MAGRITVSAGTAAVILTGLDATNSVPAYMDAGLTARVLLPKTIAGGSALVVYCADTASITPTVTDTDGTVLSATATACRAGRPVTLGPFEGSSYAPLPSGTPTAGQVPVVTSPSPLSLAWETVDGVGSSVTSVVGVDGDVTGEDILADTDVAAALSAKADAASLGTAAAAAATDFDAAGAAAAAQGAAIAASAQRASNLSDLASASTARGSLGLGGAAVLNVGTTAGTVAAGNDARLADARTPTAHAASHGVAGDDAITVTLAQVSDAGTMASEAAADYAPVVEAVNVVAASGATEVLPDPSTYGVSDVTLDQSCTFTMPTVAAAGAAKSFVVVLVQGGAGSCVPTFTGACWPEATVPSWSTAVGAVDQVMFSSTNGRAWVGVALIGVSAP